jgi:hypothetical protein
MHNGKKYLLKDSWTEQSKRGSEVEHLKRIHGVLDETRRSPAHGFCAMEIMGSRAETSKYRFGQLKHWFADVVFAKRELILAFRGIVLSGPFSLGAHETGTATDI